MRIVLVGIEEKFAARVGSAREEDCGLTPTRWLMPPSDAVSDDLLQSILQTTCVEVLARNTLCSRVYSVSCSPAKKPWQNITKQQLQQMQQGSDVEIK